MADNAKTFAAVVTRHQRWRTLIGFALALLLARVWAGILWEYRGYFPPDFAAPFLLGREKYFWGAYSVAFYAHLVSGPVSIVFAALLAWSGGRAPYRIVHRRLGRVQAALVLGVLVPSGLWMAGSSIAGPVVGVGFAALAASLAVCMIGAIVAARRRQFRSHQRWAWRCLVLLASPLLLRVVSGAAIVAQMDSDEFYRWNAWGSWLVPPNSNQH